MRILSFAILISLFTTLFFSCENEKNTSNFTIDLTATNTGDVKTFLTQQRHGEMITLDSTILVDGKTSFEGHVDLPELFYLSFDGIRAYVPVFVEQGVVSVNVDGNSPTNPQVSGSASHQLYDKYNVSISGFDERAKGIAELYNQAKQAGNEEQMKDAELAYDTVDKEKAEFTTTFVKENGSSAVAPFLVMRYNYRYNVDELDTFVAGFDSSIASSIYVEYVTNRVDILRRVAVGQPFVDFEMADTAGNLVQLSDVAKDKYLLVDFWAAWCSPCRAENPNVVEAYNKFHDKGFDVLGISFDDAHDRWIEAIKKDGLKWQQLSDLKGWQNAAGKLYGIQSIPQNVLINPEGIIIEKNLRGEDLQEKLAEVFAY